MRTGADMREGVPILVLVGSRAKGADAVFPLLPAGLGRCSIRTFQYAREPDARLTSVQKERFLAWLWLRSAINSEAATIEDRRTAWKHVLPTVSAFDAAQIAPAEKRRTFQRVLTSGSTAARQIGDDCTFERDPLYDDVTGKMPSKEEIQEYEQHFRREFYVPVKDAASVPEFLDSLEAERWSARSSNPQTAYQYLTARILRLTTVVEWRGSPAILCFSDRLIKALEVAHYAAVLMGKMPMMIMCLRCHRTFAKRSDAQFCSHKCRWAYQKASQRRRRNKQR